MGLSPVTRTQYITVTGSDPLSGSSDSEGLLAPVGYMSWSGINDSDGFLARLNAKIQTAGGSFLIRLPTEAQWEIAARAGTTTQWFFGATDTLLSQFAWHYSNTWNKMRTVGTRKPNPWGLYDVYGNVNEWCSDMFSMTYPTSTIDPIGSTSSPNNVYRGGCARSGNSVECRSGWRGNWTSTATGPAFGFRASLALRNP